MSANKRCRYITRASVKEQNFWLVWRDPWLRQRVFVHNRPLHDCLDGEKACELYYMEAITHAPFAMTFTVEMMCSAAARGNLELVKWLHFNHPETGSSRAIDRAAVCGHLDIVKWLCQNTKYGPTSDSVDWAAEFGCFAVVKWLLTNTSVRCSTYTMGFAARSGHYEIVKWLCENRSERCTVLAIGWAEREGHHKVAAYLEKHKPWL